jgi:hypothetical protein
VNKDLGLTLREASLITVAATPGSCMKQYAYEIGTSYGGLLVELKRLYLKLQRYGYKISSVRDLGLFGVGMYKKEQNMKTYLVNWSTKDHVKTIGNFQKHSGNIQSLVSGLGHGINVKQSWHACGEDGTPNGDGVMIVAAKDLEILQTAATKLSEVLDVTITQVITDKEALVALAPLVK